MAFRKPAASKCRARLEGVSIGTVDKRGIMPISIGRGLCDQLSVKVGSHVAVLLGTEEDEGKIAIDPAGEGYTLRTDAHALSVRVTARHFNLAPNRGFRPPFEIVRNTLVIDVSAIQTRAKNLASSSQGTSHREKPQAIRPLAPR